MNESPANRNRLYRNPRHGKILGVCAGLAEFFDFNMVWVRLVTVFGCFVFPFAIPVIYFALAFILDKKPKNLYQDSEHDKFWRQVRSSPQETVHDIRHKFMSLDQRIRDMETYVTSTAYRFDNELGDK